MEVVDRLLITFQRMEEEEMKTQEWPVAKNPFSIKSNYKMDSILKMTTRFSQCDQIETSNRSEC